MENESKIGELSPRAIEILESDKKARELKGELLKAYGSIDAEEFIEKVLGFADELDKAARLRKESRDEDPKIGRASCRERG